MRSIAATALIVLSFIMGVWSGEDTPELQLPAAVERALDTYDAEVDRAQDIYRVAVERAKAKAARTIEREQEAVTRKGDLELALAIKAKAEELDKHTAGGLAELDILGNKLKEEKAKAKLAPLLGKWTCTAVAIKKDYQWSFSEDGRITGTHNFLWKIEGENLIIYDETRPVIMTFPLPIRGKEWAGRHTNGQQHTLAKQ